MKPVHGRTVKRIGKTEIEIRVGDITEMTTDAIVNAANSLLAHGGGVAGAIARKGGPMIQEESDLWVKVRGKVPAGSCAITSAGRLATRYVIHAVGPRMGEGDEDIKLRLATLSAIETAERHNLKTIAFPAVSAGIFGGGAGYIIPDFYRDMGKDGDYVFSAASWNYDINCADVARFSEAYEKKHGEFLNEHAGEAYVMMWVIADALESAGSTDPKKVREALVATNLTKGPGAAMPGCRVEFDAMGWNKHVHPVMTQWQKGQLRTVYPASDARLKPTWPVPPWKKR